MTREGKSSNVVTYNSIVDAIGLWVTSVIGFVIEYSTSNAYSPVLDVADSCRTGAATNVILGLAVGYKSVIIQIFAIADVVGKSHLIRERTDTLDAIGITTDLLLWFFWHSLVPFACSDRTFVREYHKKLPRFISAFSPNHAVLSSSDKNHLTRAEASKPEMPIKIWYRRTSGPTRRSTKGQWTAEEPVRKDIDECSSELSNVLFEDEREKKKKCDVNSSEGGKVVRCAIDEVMKEDEKVKEQINRKDYWLCEGIVVKVMRKGLDNKGYYYKQRGLVVNVIDMYLAEIEMLERKDVIRARQAELETVIPHNGGLVKIVNGKCAYRGSNVRLISLDMDEFCAK
ncbi:hypothetical protein IFM89_026064, partial [Coptis chinensis]